MSQFGCPICREKLNSCVGANISALACGHVFHEECIKRWLKCNPSCPHCRYRSDPKSLLKLFFNYASSDMSFANVPNSATDLLEQNQHLHGEILSYKDKLNSLEENYQKQVESRNEFLNLYNQTSDLLREVNQKYNRAKAQLASYHSALAEAEAMKEECVQLREHVERLKDVETLIRGSDSSANELMEKYRDQLGNFSPEVISELFKWLAVLRSEISDGKLRFQKYRKDAYRLRRAHASANSRVSYLERKLENYTSRIAQLETDLAQMCEQSRPGFSSNGLTTSDDSANPVPTTPLACDSSSFNETRLDLDRCLSFIDLTTPEINSKSTGIPAPTRSGIDWTPLVNPFKRTSTHSDKPKLIKKHSSLFKLAIMRDYGSSNPKSAPYNGYGGHEGDIRPGSVFNRLKMNSKSSNSLRKP